MSQALTITEPILAPTTIAEELAASTVSGLEFLL
jgi:hypothetical protein